LGCLVRCKWRETIGIGENSAVSRSSSTALWAQGGRDVTPGSSLENTRKKKKYPKQGGNRPADREKLRKVKNRQDEREGSIEKPGS